MRINTTDYPFIGFVEEMRYYLENGADISMIDEELIRKISPSRSIPYIPSDYQKTQYQRFSTDTHECFPDHEDDPRFAKFFSIAIEKLAQGPLDIYYMPKSINKHMDKVLSDLAPLSRLYRYLEMPKNEIYITGDFTCFMVMVPDDALNIFITAAIDTKQNVIVDMTLFALSGDVWVPFFCWADEERVGDIMRALELNEDYENAMTFVSTSAYSVLSWKIFKDFAPVELIELKPKAKRKVNVPTVGPVRNSTGIPVQVIDSSWFRTITRSEGFEVKGHFRLQPYGPGRSKRRLTWIKSFEKKGYTRVAKKEKE